MTFWSVGKLPGSQPWDDHRQLIKETTVTLDPLDYKWEALGNYEFVEGVRPDGVTGADKPWVRYDSWWDEWRMKNVVMARSGASSIAHGCCPMLFALGCVLGLTKRGGL